MDRRQFIVYSSVTGGAGLLTLLFGCSFNWQKKDRELVKEGRVSLEDKTAQVYNLRNDEVGVWFYPGYMSGDKFVWDLDLMNQEYIDVMLKYYINTIYIGGSDALLFNSPQGLFDWKDNLRRMKNFSRECEESGIEVAMLGFDDHHFLDPEMYDDSRLCRRFSDWIELTGELATKYQIDLEPHGWDVESKPVGRQFRNNPRRRKELLKRYLHICEMFYEIAENSKKIFAPAVPLVDYPSVAPENSMNYDKILRQEFEEGLNRIPAHYLILMSYTWNAKELLEVAKRNIGNIERPFALAATNFPNAWDPYFDSAKEFNNVPAVIKELRKINPNLKGYLIFANVSLKDKLTHIYHQEVLPSEQHVDRKYLIERAKGL